MSSETATVSKGKKPKLALPILYTFTAFVGASLIFLVQPLVSKLLLPSYGGSAAVWTTSSFFFQVVLLGGYVLVHGLVKLGPKRQPFTHLPLLLIAIIALPLALPANAAPSGDSPTGWLIRTLILMIALPFLVLSMTGPTLQKWYSWTDAPRADDPYFIYAASNVGSFFGLLSYPFLLEPHFSLATQRMVWSWSFVIFGILMAICGLTVWKHNKDQVSNAVETVQEIAEKLSVSKQAIWVFLAFIPSSLMLGATTYITTDVASIPLLWIIPLALYLATMIWAFGRTSRELPKKTIVAAFFSSLVCLFLVSGAITPSRSSSIYVVAAIVFISLTIIALASHMALAATRPSATYLTRYFVLVSFGGALGGAFNSFVAPTIFNSPLEYPIVLACTALLLYALKAPKFMPAGLAILLIAAFYVNELDDPGLVEKSRTFYGSYSVRADSSAVSFTHGTTLHGLQYFDAKDEPSTYYSKKGPLGDVFGLKQYENVAAVGLGSGTIATYGNSNMNLTFIEIDPEVLRIAEKYFTYLKDTPAAVTNVIGDGRLEIAKLPAASQDLIILDAFSSDSIPIHLLTQEAMKEYSSKLTDDGVIAVHISNRYFDLVPVVVSDANATGMTPLYRYYEVGNDDRTGTDSVWMTLTKDGAKKDKLIAEGWKDLSDVKPVNWTDDYSSILDVLL